MGSHVFAKLIRTRLAYVYGQSIDRDLNRADYTVPRRHCQSISAAATPVWSLYNCKRIVKSSKYGFTEGPACIETTCPCAMPNKGNQIYINKTSGTLSSLIFQSVAHDSLILIPDPLSGNFICPKCQYVGKFSAIEDFFPEPKAKDQQVEVAQKREKFQARKQVVQLELPSVTSVKDVPDEAVSSLLDKFLLVNIE